MAARMQVQPEARRGDLVEVRVLIQHPMETGFRYDSLGRQTPRNVIYRFECRYGGVEVFRAEDGLGGGFGDFRFAAVMQALAGDARDELVRIDTVRAQRGRQIDADR